MNDDETPLSGLAPPVKKKTTAWQVVCEFRFGHRHCHTGPLKFTKEVPVRRKTRSIKAAVQVVRKFLESHGYDASNVDADDVSNYSA